MNVPYPHICFTGAAASPSQRRLTWGFFILALLTFGAGEFFVVGAVLHIVA